MITFAQSTLRSFTAASVRSLAASPLLLAIVIFGLALGPRLLDLGVFVGPDEFTWDARSANFARALASGNLAETYQDGYPGVTLMWVETLGAWLRYGLHGLNGSADWDAIIGPQDSMAMLSSKRQVLGIANALIVVCSTLLIYRLFGRGVAWLAGFLLAFDPFLLTESRALRSEGIMTGFSTLALLSMLLYLKERRAGYSALAGVLTGLAVLSKVSAVALLPVGGLVIGAAALFSPAGALARRWREPGGGWSWPRSEKLAILSLPGQFKTQIKNLSLAWLIYGGALLLTLFVVWPALWVGPIEVAQKMYEYVNVRVVEGNEGGQSFFLGKPLADEEVGPLFYPVVLLYRTGPLVWLGLILLALLGGSKRWLARPDKLAVGVLLLYLAVYLAMITSSTLKYDRFIIPMLPTLDLLAALGLALAWRWLTTKSTSTNETQNPHPHSKIQNLKSKIQNPLVLALGVLGVQLALTLPHHPYYYTYWNPLLGGLKQAAQVLPVGVGEGIEQAAAYLNTLPQPETIRLALANSQKIDPVFKGPTIALENVAGHWVQSDYTLIYISQLQRGKHDPNLIDYLRRKSPVFTVTLHGLEYAWLYPGPAAQYYGGGYKLEGRGSLFGYDLGRTELAAGELLPVTLYWRNEGQLDSDRFFVRVMDLDGYVWAEALAQPRPGFETANRQREAIVESEAVLNLPAGMPPGDYFLKFGFRTEQGELIGYFELPGSTRPLKIQLAKSYPSPDILQLPHPAQFLVNTDLALPGYNLEPAVVAPGATTWVTLYWQARTDVTHDYVILLRLVDQTQQELAYWLGRPVRSGYPTPQWRAGQIVQDPWLLSIPPDMKAGVYGLEIAVFDAESEKEINRQLLGQVMINLQ